MTQNAAQNDREPYEGLIQAIVEECRDRPFSYQLKNSPTGSIVLKLSRTEQAKLAMSMLRRIMGGDPPYETLKRSFSHSVQGALFALLKRKLPFTTCEVIQFLDALQIERSLRVGVAQFKGVVRNYLKDNPLEEELRAAIEQTCQFLEKSYYDRKHAADLRQLLPHDRIAIPLQAGEAWSDLAISQLEGLADSEREAWCALLSTCLEASGGKPSVKWV